MKKKSSLKRSSMRDRVKQHVKETRKGSKLLALPPEVDVFYPTEKCVVEMDILPYVVSDPNHPDDVAVGELWYRRPYFLHFIERKPYVCPRSVGKPCPICEEVERLSKDYEDNKEIISAIKRREMCLFNFVDPADKKGSVKIFDWSSFKFAQELERELDESDDPNDWGFADLEGGSTLKFRISEESISLGKFFKCTRLDFRHPRKTYDESILEKVIDLDTILRVKSYDDLAKVLFGTGEEDEVKEEKKEKPKAKKSEKKPKPEPEPEEDDEDIDDSEDDDDEDWDDEDDAEDTDVDDSEDDDDDEELTEDDDDEDDEDDTDVDDDDEDDDDDEEDFDDDDEDFDDEDDEEEDDSDDDDEEEVDLPSKKEVLKMKKEELIALYEGPLEGKAKKSLTALKRMPLSELRKITAGLV